MKYNRNAFTVRRLPLSGMEESACLAQANLFSPPPLRSASLTVGQMRSMTRNQRPASQDMLFDPIRYQI
jgi:hypothetical protein